jgi:LysR family hydrogen peroxide-inducible transcriptional activator
MRFSPHPITLRQLQYLVAVAEHGNFRKAAAACHVSQPSLSAQVAQAEDVLGVRLFERNQHGVVVTPAGKAVADQARSLCVGADALIEAARHFADPFAGRLRIGVIPTVAPYLLPEVAPALRKRYPKLTLLWTEEKTEVLVHRLARGELDAAILALEADVGDVETKVLGQDPFVFAVAAGHPMASSHKPVKPEELEGQPVLLLDDGHCFRKQVLSFCSRSGADEAGYRATSLATLVQMTAGGVGVTLLPSLALPVENRHKVLHVRTFAPKAPSRTLALCWRRGAALAATLEPVGETMHKVYEAMARHAGFDPHAR